MNPRNVAWTVVVGALCYWSLSASAQSPPVCEQIMVDQFGYRVAGRKLAIFASPEKGFNSNVKYTPPAKAVIRSAATKAEVMTVELKEWNGGKVDNDSGDKVWHADFTALQKPGLYYFYDPENKVRSYDFRIAEDPYAPILKAAVRMFFFNRCGCDLPAASAGNWAHPACHVNPKQDKEAQLYVDGKLMGQPRDVHGGWHDAGDYDKYVPFTMTALGCLLAAYEWNPSAFGDNWGIPESGNGIPDILDEIKVEMDWMLRMQVEDGSVCNRVAARGAKGGVSPELDPITRFYTQPTSWATATAAAHYAHAARVFGQIPKTKVYAKGLREAAEKAWAWLEKHPDMIPADGRDHGSPSDAAQGDGNANQDRRDRFIAAAELFALDGQAKYGDYVREHIKDPRMADNDGQPLVRGWFAPAQGDEILRACIDYAGAPKADPSIVADIKAALKKGADGDYVRKYTSMADPYMAPVPGYWWGSNQIKAECGDFGTYAIRLGVNPPANAQYRAVSEEFVHYFHGRNPLCLVYLTNMGEKGAKAGAGKCVMQPFHSWWLNNNQWDGPNSKFGPAPGYLVGGPNPGDVPSWISPPSGQPPEKSFKDWNGNWNTQHNATENSWAITEPAIYYQARYVLLLSQFVGKPPAAAAGAPRM